MQAHQLSSRWRAAVLLAVGMLALIALAACGSDDGDAPAAGAPPTQAPLPTAAPAPTASPTPAPPAAPMVPATAPEPGSDVALVMAVLEKQVRAVNARDYALFQETCTPSGGEPPTVAQLRFIYEEREGVVSVPNQATIRFSPQGYNVRNVKVKLLRAPFAQASSTFSWITRPLCTTRTNLALRILFPSSSKRGDWKIMSSVCHWPGTFAAFTRGGEPASMW